MQRRRGLIAVLYCIVSYMAVIQPSQCRRTRRLGGEEGRLQAEFFGDVIDCADLITCDLCAAGKSSILRMKCQWCGNGRCHAKTTGFFSMKWCDEATTEMCNAESRYQTPPRSLKPEDWFLTKEEMTESRGGHDRQNLRTFTRKNRVEFLQTGKDVFEQVYRDLERTGANDHVLFSQWCFGPETLPFIATDPGGTQLGDTFAAAVERGVEVNFLIWRNTVNAVREDADKYHRVFQNRMSEAAQSDACKATRTRCANSKVLIDGRGPGKAGSIHQKFSIMRHGDDLSAMVGGIDLNWARWDTVQHGTSPLRDQYVRDPNDEEGKGGWIDRHMKVVGEAAKDLGNSFVQRWNSDNPLDKAGSWVLDALSFATGPEIEIVDANPTEEEKLSLFTHEDDATSSGDDTRNAAVQIVRTYPCEYELISGWKTFHWEFAPRGEFSYLRAAQKAILRAREYIYIEDQYGLYMDELFGTIARALEGGEVKLVVLIARSSGVHLAGCATSQYEMWMPLKTAYPKKVTLTVRIDHAFVHSKMMIVDDIWALIGSANIGYRSFTSDPEIGGAVVDEHTIRRKSDNLLVAKFAHDARVRSWAEQAKERSSSS
eukprot:g5505.t1